jgi:hypothetical protein
MDIVSEKEAATDPIPVTPEAIALISAAIEETAQARAQQKVAAIGNNILESIQRFTAGCSGASIEQIASDVKYKIILPVLKGETPEIPDWILEAERAEILSSAQSFIGNTRERFTPFPYGIMKVSEFRLSEFMSNHKVSVLHEPSRETENRTGPVFNGDWVAHAEDGTIARGDDPSKAVNNLFMKVKSVANNDV